MKQETEAQIPSSVKAGNRIPLQPHSDYKLRKQMKKWNMT